MGLGCQGYNYSNRKYSSKRSKYIVVRSRENKLLKGKIMGATNGGKVFSVL